MSRALSSDFSFAVTNPLHFVYFPGHGSVRAVATHGSLAEDSARDLGFENISYVTAANSVAGIIDADTGHAGPYLAWRSALVDKPMLGNPHELTARIESKASVRGLIDEGLFAPFVVMEAGEFLDSDFAALCASLNATSLVAQADNSTGGKGTFFIYNDSDLTWTKGVLRDNDQKIVVSALIKGTSRALQCIRIGSETFVQDWWHRDLVSIDGVFNDAVADATRYCGAVLENVPENRRSEIHELARRVGDQIGSLGYQGVFGIDIVVPDDDSQAATLIEVNARLTAVSHLYATAMHAVGYTADYMTLGFMQAAGLAVDPSEFRETRPLAGSYYYLKLQNLTDVSEELGDAARLGVYGADNGYLRLGWGIDALGGDEEIVVIPEVGRHVSRAPGQRTFSVIGKGNPLDGSGLSVAMRERLAALNASMLQ